MRQSITRVRSYIESSQVATGDTNLVLFTADENITIRRIIGYIKTSGEGTGVFSNPVNFAFTVAPNGVVNESALNSETLADPVTRDYLGGGLLIANQGQNQQQNVDSVVWETKGMRKLRKNDQLVFSHAGLTAQGIISAYFDIFLGQ